MLVALPPVAPSANMRLKQSYIRVYPDPLPGFNPGHPTGQLSPIPSFAFPYFPRCLNSRSLNIKDARIAGQASPENPLPPRFPGRPPHPIHRESPMAPPFKSTEVLRFLLWIAVLMTAVVAILWMLFHAPGQKAVPTNGATQAGWTSPDGTLIGSFHSGVRGA